MYMMGLLLYRSISSIWRRTLSLRAEDRTLISSRVISCELCCAATPTKSCTSGRLFLRCSAKASCKEERSAWNGSKRVMGFAADLRYVDMKEGSAAHSFMRKQYDG